MFFICGAIVKGHEYPLFILPKGVKYNLGKKIWSFTVLVLKIISSELYFKTNKIIIVEQ